MFVEAAFLSAVSKLWSDWRDCWSALLTSLIQCQPKGRPWNDRQSHSKSFTATIHLPPPPSCGWAEKWRLLYRRWGGEAGFDKEREGGSLPFSAHTVSTAQYCRLFFVHFLKSLVGQRFPKTWVFGLLTWVLRILAEFLKISFSEGRQRAYETWVFPEK